MTFDPKTETELVGKLLGSEPVKELLNPVTHEIGQLIGELGNIARYYGTENLKKIFTKWARDRQQGVSSGEGKVIEAMEFQRIMPLLPAASLQSDDELQNRWAALLESAASADPDYLPGFGTILAQISAEEARFLDRINKFPVAFSRTRATPSQIMEAVSESLLVYIYDPAIFSRFGELALPAAAQMNPNEIPETGAVAQARLFINDFLRLGLLGEVQTLEQEKDRTAFDAFRRVPRHDLSRALASIPALKPSHLRTQYALTRYAVSFIRAVSPQQAGRANS